MPNPNPAHRPQGGLHCHVHCQLGSTPETEPRSVMDHVMDGAVRGLVWLVIIVQNGIKEVIIFHETARHLPRGLPRPVYFGWARCVPSPLLRSSFRCRCHCWAPRLSSICMSGARHGAPRHPRCFVPCVHGLCLRQEEVVFLFVIIALGVECKRGTWSVSMQRATNNKLLQYAPLSPDIICIKRLGPRVPSCAICAVSAI